MGTSRSSRPGKWVAGVLIYSGLPDPTWEVKAAVGQKLSRYWASLERVEKEFSFPSGLGYRGCFLKGQGHEWRAYRNAVMLKKASGYEVRLDEKCRFEKTLLASAPDELLPPSLKRDG